jgi:hypothetical protein
MTTAQKAAAKNNIKNAAAAAKKKKTIAHLPKATRTALGKKGAEAAKKKRDLQGTEVSASAYSRAPFTLWGGSKGFAG